MAAKKYTALVGINVPPNDERHEAGDEVFLSDRVARPLLALGSVERITESRDHPDETAEQIEAAKVAEDATGAIPADVPEEVED